MTAWKHITQHSIYAVANADALFILPGMTLIHFILFKTIALTRVIAILVTEKDICHSIFITHNIEEAVYLSDRILVLTNKPLYTIPIATQIFYGSMGGSDMGCVLAALILAMLPILILYLIMQKYIVEGVTSGAVKG
jgi:hypothetical protein